MGSPHRGTDKSMSRPFKCPRCGKDYAMEWALQNHIKHCKEDDKEKEKE